MFESLLGNETLLRSYCNNQPELIEGEYRLSNGRSICKKKGNNGKSSVNAVVQEENSRHKADSTRKRQVEQGLSLLN